MHQGRRTSQAFTLIELLCTMAIIGLMAALLLPTVSKGFARARRIYCINSLRQMGLAFHGFAHGHEDKFPIQVSTNGGGSLEWLLSSYGLNDEFYFSYRHFLPLSNDVPTPKILACPADVRQPAANYESFRNENLSYFVAANPEFGKPDSVLAGDRNLTPTFGSVARIGGVLYLKWTYEMHQYKGNVLFADGHVEQMNGVLRLTNATTTKVESLLVPSIQPSGGSSVSGVAFPSKASSAMAGSGSSSTRFMFTNRITATNPIQITTVNNRKPVNPLAPAPSSGSAVVGSVSGNRGAGTGFAPAAEEPSTPKTMAQPAPATGPHPPPESPKTTAEGAVAAAKRAATAAVAVVYAIPWYLILLLLLAMVELRRRVRKREKQRAARSKFVVPRSVDMGTARP
jgi:prepilin-type N-terminal cleavage/methylation domain-containing protein/prepilin-type processing-associated H-X9-DG protein